MQASFCSRTLPADLQIHWPLPLSDFNITWNVPFNKTHKYKISLTSVQRYFTYRTHISGTDTAELMGIFLQIFAKKCTFTFVP
jgi:hypothetical protein